MNIFIEIFYQAMDWFLLLLNKHLLLEKYQNGLRCGF